MLVAAAAVVVELVVDESVTGSGVVALSEIGSHHASVVLEPSGLEVLVSVSAVGRTLEVDLRAREGEAEGGGEGEEGEEEVEVVRELFVSIPRCGVSTGVFAAGSGGLG